MYQCGFLGNKDFDQARSWYRRAAGHSNALAENQLGFLAQQGWGQPEDDVEALSWYMRAADQGNAEAEGNIGFLYQHGMGVQTDYAKAMSWYYKAAGQGNTTAENQIGWMYQHGLGMTVDLGQALTWYRLSAEQGNQNGIDNLKALTAILKSGDGSQWAAANASAADAAAAQTERSRRIKELHRRIEELEFDARQEESLAARAQQPARGSGAGAAILNTLSAFGSARFQLEAAQYHDQAARLREELAELENQNQFAASVPTP